MPEANIHAPSRPAAKAVLLAAALSALAAPAFAQDHSMHGMPGMAPPGEVPPAQDELSELALTFNHMLDRIEQLMAGVTHVSDAIAHNLRTPLTRLRLRLQQQGQRLSLWLPAGWAERYPQSAHLLREEAQDWLRTPWELVLELG